jgi:hypothetical protein
MAKLTIAVAALVALSVAGTRVQAQSEQFASVDQTVFAAQTVSFDQPTSVDQPIAVDPSVSAEPSVALEPKMSTETVIVQDVPVTASVEVAAPTGPSMQSATLSPRRSHSQSIDANTMRRRPSRGSGVGLMILGGAALITGLIIGDNAGTVIAVGGALIGLYGLYVYLGRPTGMEHNNRIGLGYKLNTP